MIQRYTVNAPDSVFLPWGDEVKTGASIDPDTHFGEWVKYEDAAKLEADLSALQRRVELLEAFVVPAKVLVDVLPNTCQCEQCTAVEALEKAIAALESKS